ncbi:IQ and ubiquitin-like domain-containing protein [Perognathus longimembris pacificus]|uniref:IQ and ubiquitin-like domain-containing protein n=1 Tax=Perognathus longimembris pacificus TaxID=214514 RepID=UPI002019A8E9|nr:IQ and ubiquitin-like domain-containing protein [Perognathus longimembris pacificus]
MSDQEAESMAESDEAAALSEQLQESYLMEEQEFECEEFTDGDEALAPSEYTIPISESYYNPAPEERKSSIKSLVTLEQQKMRYEMESDQEFLSDDNLTFLNRIKAVKESLHVAAKESAVTVKVILIPVGQEITMSFKVDCMIKHLKDHFSQLLGIPAYALQVRYAGKILKDKDCFIQQGVKPTETVQVEIMSTCTDIHPMRRIEGLQEFSKIMTVSVQTGTNQFKDITVEFIKSDFHKPFLGGFRHKITGTEYHNAGTQTVPRKVFHKPNRFCRDTQTVIEKQRYQQTANTTSTQMTKIGVYVANMEDKLIEPVAYFTAAEYHARRLKAVIVIQTYYRRWHAKVYVEDLKRQKQVRLDWEVEDQLRKEREREDRLRADYQRRHNPKTNEDFELLFNALELWRQEELARIDQYFTGAERKAYLCELLEKETQLIASIGRHRDMAHTERKEAAVQAFLNKCSAPRVWRRADGKVIEMDTQFTLRARELQNIYKCIIMKNVSHDERLDVLLTLKHTVKEHECKLTQEILELIDREVDLMMRGVKSQNLEGLRKRTATLFFHYIKTPLFNPEVARYLKVPQDPLKFYNKIYFCYSCQLYLPSTEFSISCTSQRIYRCRQCVSLENETQKRESFLKYKCILERLYESEANYEDDSQIAFLMQLNDIRYLIENIWASQSVLSACKDIDELVMVRWDKSMEWAPWNCILLTKEEGEAHLKVQNIEQDYEHYFLHKIQHKHILAKNYFSQIPLLASYILNHSELEDVRNKYQVDTTPKTIEAKGTYS